MRKKRLERKIWRKRGERQNKVKYKIKNKKTSKRLYWTYDSGKTMRSGGENMQNSLRVSFRFLLLFFIYYYYHYFFFFTRRRSAAPKIWIHVYITVNSPRPNRKNQYWTSHRITWTFEIGIKPNEVPNARTHYVWWYIYLHRKTDYLLSSIQ